ncbi:MAG: acetate--CoA ligase family protein [Thermodesulfobacteriota bacterium]|nr:acetate--CoA ligase family protein [Thermodesulfobacteriota bacterium]
MEPKKGIEIINRAKQTGWVMEPEAKDLLKRYGLSTSTFKWVKSLNEAAATSKDIGFPLVMKIVSPDILHKTEVNGVVVGIRNTEELTSSFERLSALKGFAGVIIEKMEKGVELIIGSKEDPQFGTIVLIGIGGTSVEIYKDVAIRMAPVTNKDVVKALNSLKGYKLLQGYRGQKKANINNLSDLIANFSNMVYELRDYVESADLNPVFCNEKKAVIADARFILK